MFDQALEEIICSQQKEQQNSGGADPIPVHNHILQPSGQARGKSLPTQLQMAEPTAADAYAILSVPSVSCDKAWAQTGQEEQDNFDEVDLEAFGAAFGC